MVVLVSLVKKVPRGRHPAARERAEIVKKFKRRCKKLGWSVEGALRHLIHNYLADPYPLQQRVVSRSRKDTLLTSVHDDMDKVIAFRAHVVKAGISTAEAIRQLVAKDLNESNG